jgi:hypothetical protein
LILPPPELQQKQVRIERVGGRSRSGDALLVYYELVVQPELALGRSGEVSSHQNLAVDVRS